MKTLIACLLLTSTVVAAPRLVILRGDSAGNAPLEFVADETSLAQAKLGGISGAELLAVRGQRLLEQAEIYRSAQRSAGATDPAPLYVVLEPAGTWAYASPWGTFSYQRDNQNHGPITTPFLKLGEKMDHNSQALDAGEESAAANRILIEKARAFWESELRAKKARRIPDFNEVLDRLTISTGGAPVGLSKAAERLPTERFLTYLERVVASDLSSHGLDGKARFAAFAQETNAPALVSDVNRAMLQRGVAETVAHELGHVIQFAALGLYNYKGAALPIHMRDNTHSLQTLSTPEFALVEGWGAANSMVVVGLPRERSPGEANRIDYSGSLEASKETANEAQARLVAAALRQANILKPGEAFATPPLSQDPAEFRAALREAAAKAGLPDSAFPDLDRDPDLQAKLRAHAYIKDLQSRKGQLRSRYDFLRSEYAVANTLARLRAAIGPDASREVVATLARHRSRDLASLIEAYVHDYPNRRLQTYRILAESTEGILITPAQLAAVESADRAGQPLHVDFDQDGQVPGPSANAALAALFPRDMPTEDPLPIAKPSTLPAAAQPLAPADEEQIQLAPPSGARTIPPAVEPEMSGLERQ